MNLHDDKQLFSEIILRASQSVANGGLGINAGFIEKDYWITRALQQLSGSTVREYAVFKGGTSLSKIFKIGARFSEDVDVAIIHDSSFSDAKIKNIIRNVQRAMSEGLEAVDRPGVTSKGSRYRKVYFAYPLAECINPIENLLSGQLLLEINSFGNPFPFSKRLVGSFVYDYLAANGFDDIIDEYNLKPFVINVLDKQTTLTEKILSLFRYSLSDNPISDMSAKIRHFYDLHHLMLDAECLAFVTSDEFRNAFHLLLSHDRKLFAQPDGWQNKPLSQSPLINNFDALWDILSVKYNDELPSLAYSQIPAASEIGDSIKRLIELLR